MAGDTEGGTLREGHGAGCHDQVLPLEGPTSSFLEAELCEATPPPSAVSWLYGGTMMAHTGVPLNGTQIGPRQEGNSLSVKDQALQASENLSVRYWFLQDPTQR